MTRNEKLFWWVAVPIIVTWLVFVALPMWEHTKEVVMDYWEILGVVTQ